MRLKVVERATVDVGMRGNIESQEHLDGQSAKPLHSTPERLQPHLEDASTMNPCNHRYPSA
jgi:hypothetical protein